MPSAADPSWAIYDLGRLADNLAELRRRAGHGRKFFAAIKGNAYGHGVVPVARALAGGGIDGLMTGSLEEARRVKAAGVAAPLILFPGALPEGLAEVLAAGMIPTVVDMAGARAAAACGAKEQPAAVCVKVDMGLGRLGIPCGEAESFLAGLAELPGLWVAGLYTHLPFADEAGLDWARQRFAAFDALLERLDTLNLRPPFSQAGASSSLAAGLEDRADAVCVGHLLYGLSPFSGAPVGHIAACKPILREIGSQLVQVTDHRQGSDIAIAGAYGIRQSRRTGVAPIGAAHGLQRPVPGSSPAALVAGRRAPVLAVSLEHLTIDLDGVPDAEPGDAVLLLGRDGQERIDLEELARWSGLSCLDMVLAVSGRLRARYESGA